MIRAERIARLIQARNSCAVGWVDKHNSSLKDIMGDAPSGSGLDAGTTLGDSTPERLVFNTSFHHMNDVGYYDGWTDHQVIVTASLTWGLNIRITGRNRNDIKDYLAEVFELWLNEEITI